MQTDRRTGMKKLIFFYFAFLRTRLKIFDYEPGKGETAVARWLRRCTTNRKVAGSIPDGVTGIFH